MIKKKHLNWKMISYTVLLVTAVLFFFMATRFIIFPKKYKLPLLGILAAVLLVMGLLSLLNKKGKTVVSILNILLSVCLITGSLFLPNLENRLRNIFKDTGNTEEFVMNVYTFTQEYKSTHPGIFPSSVTSTEITDYSSFLTQSAMDLENQSYAVEQLRSTNADMNVIEKSDILDAVSAFYNGEAECLILNEVYVDSVEELEGFDHFSEDTQILTSITREVIVEPTPEPEPVDEGIRPFIIMIAGEDTRSSRLSTYGRTDVDMVVTVNPNTKQVLICGFPRDAYIKNPALHNGLDKLTHLGNNGIQNTMKGLSVVLDHDITEYAVVNFVTFKKLIDAIGGVDVENPYSFTTKGGNGNYHSTPYDFPKGNVHLDGTMALAYCRERYNLKNGDYGRSEHQTIVLKAVINKLTSTELLSNYSAILDSMQGQVLTSLNSDLIYGLVAKQLEDNTSYNVISYHLGGIGDMQPTASMGSRRLYVTWLFNSQLTFMKYEMDKVINGEQIIQDTLPDEDKTTYIPN